MIKVGSDFSGVGAFNQSLIRLGIEYKEVFACDMDKYARQTFIHNYGEPEYYPTNVYDRAIPTEPLDIYMTSPPCQAFSLAGKRLGKDDKRGILFFNSYEFIQINKPRYFIFENVKGLLSDDGGKTFSEWVNMLGGKSVNGNPVIFPYEESVPYHIYWKVLNAKDYGVPQNRERVFIIGIRDDEDNKFRFPPEEFLTKRLKDVLDNEVDQKYFLSDSTVNKLVEYDKRQKENGNGFGAKFHDINDTMSSLKVGGGGCDDLVKIGDYRTDEGFRWREDNNSPTLCARAREDGSGQPVIQIKSATSKGYEEATEGDSINFSVPNSETRRGRVGKQVAQTLDTGCQQGVIIHDIPEIVKVRKHKVDIIKLQECLKNHKQKSIKQITKELNVNKTTVEHWFRTDKYFSIPDAEIWFELKKCLNIETNEFDLSVTEFIEKEGVFEKSNRVYDENGIAPTMTSTSADEKILTQSPEIKPLFQYGKGNKGERTVYHKNGISPCMTAGMGMGGGITPSVIKDYKIRRLTPRECFRLMDFPDSFTWPVSDSQAYKQAGNSIVVNVLYKIIKNLNLKK